MIRLGGRNFFWLLPLLALISYPLWMPPASDFLNPEGRGSSRADSSRAGGSLTLEDVVLSQFNRGRNDWRIDAEHLVTDNDASDLRLDKVDAVFLDQDSRGSIMRPAVHITSEHARYVEDQKTLTLTDKVIVTTESGYEIHAGRVRFLEGERQFKADAGVRIAGNNLTIHGRTLTYNLDTKSFQVDGEVDAQFH